MGKSDLPPLLRPCPCGTGRRYAECCEPYISGRRHAPNAEALMRSRYTAYTLPDQKYLERTWHARSRPVLNLLTSDQQKATKWMGLEVLAHSHQGNKATVEFVARYKVNGRACMLHEVSKFEYETGQWFYVDGDIRD